jgi:hypothetical protein
MSGSTWPTALTAPRTCSSNWAVADSTVVRPASVIGPVGLGPQRVSRLGEGGGERVPVTDVGGEGGGGDTQPGQFADHGVQLLAATGDQPDPEAMAAERASHPHPEPGPRTDDNERLSHFSASPTSEHLLFVSDIMISDHDDGRKTAHFCR